MFAIYLHVVVGADAEVGEWVAVSTWDVAVWVMCFEAAGGPGGPVGSPDVLVSVCHWCLSPVMLIDGAGIKAVAV